MEPNKLDKKFRKALQEREIAPTPAAWDRLDAMLTVAEEKKAATSYNWLYIAATLLGFIAIAIVFLSKTEQLVDVRRDEVVYQNDQPAEVKDSLKQQAPTQIIAPKSSEAVVESNQKNPVNPKQKNNRSSLENQNQQEKRNTQSPLANPQQDALANNNQLENHQQSIINQKTEQINQLSSPINQPNQQAVAQLEAAPKIGKTPIKVSASNLLSEVDGELELSFREKVINKIDKNYKTVKVALANRNQQSDVNQ